MMNATLNNIMQNCQCKMITQELKKINKKMLIVKTFKFQKTLLKHPKKFNRYYLNKRKFMKAKIYYRLLKLENIIFAIPIEKANKNPQENSYLD